jgi:replicative DNA helicase
MQIKDFDGKDERRILIGMIVSDKVLSRIADKFDKEMFSSKWANLVAGWCIAFYGKYKHAAGKGIEGPFSRWANKSDDKKTVDLVESFLESLSDEYDDKEINADHLIDRAAEYFNRVKLEKLKTSIADDLARGDTDAAQERVQKHRQIEMGIESLDDPYQDSHIHIRTFESEEESLIKYPGALGRFFGDRLQRGGFIAFQAPEKGKKSFWLMDIVHRGLQARNKVLYFIVGDMSKNQITKRLQVRMTGRPRRSGERYEVPVKFRRRKDDYPYLKRVTRTTKYDLDMSIVSKAQSRFNETYLRSKHSFIKMSCTATLSIQEIRSRLQRLYDLDNWVPDIIVLDYVDLLDPPRGTKEKRDQINENWRQLRVLSLEQHCLVVTATQANSKAYKENAQTREHFSDNKLKMAHVTGLIGINQWDDLENQQLLKLNWIVVREGERQRAVWCASCLAIGNPSVLSC